MALVALPLAILLSLSVEALRARLTLSESELAKRTERMLAETRDEMDRALRATLEQRAAQALETAGPERYELEPDGKTLAHPASGYWAQKQDAPLPGIFGRQLDWGLRLTDPQAQVKAWDEMLTDWPTPREEAIVRFRRAVSLMQQGRAEAAEAELSRLVETAGRERDPGGIPLCLLAQLYLGRLHQSVGETFRAVGVLTQLERHLAARAWRLEGWQHTFYREQVDARLGALTPKITSSDERRYLARGRATNAQLARRIAWVGKLLREGLAAGPDWRARPVAGSGLIYHRRRPDGSIVLFHYPQQTVEGWLPSLLGRLGAARQARFVLTSAPDNRHLAAGPLLPGIQLEVDPWGLRATGETARQRVWLYAGSIGLALAMIAIGLITGYRFVCREVEAARSKEAFLASISHELKTPLTSIRIFAESMADGGVPEEKVQEYARRIDRESRRLGRLIEGVLDLAALERGQVTLSLRPLLAEQVFAEAMLLFEHRAAATRCGLELDPIGCELGIVADQDALVQVLLILLDNAAKYSPEGGRVLLAASADASGAICLRVEDEGPGIPESERTRVLGRFYRGSNVGTTPGLGLGLSIAATLVRAMHGQLEISAAAGGGTAAHVRLPAASDEESAG